MKKLFVTRKIADTGLNRLKDHFEIKVWQEYASPPREVMLREFAEVDAAITLLSDKIDDELLKLTKNLKIISQMAVGFDNIDVKSATAHNICVTNTPDVLTDSSADFSFALLMAISRRVAEADKMVRSGNWKVAWHPSMLLGKDVCGSTLGIIGAGRIGQAMAKRGKGFDMKILYYSRQAKPEFEKECKAVRVELDELIKQSDFISLHCPLTPETKGLFNKERIALMKQGAYLINNSRGPVIDEQALYDALKNNKIAGAALDVFEKEPISADNPLLSLDNIVFAPHISSAGKETREKMSAMAAESLLEFFSGKKPTNALNDIKLFA